MCGLVFWPLVGGGGGGGGNDSLRYALWPAPLCLAFVGFLPLAMVEAGGQMEASGVGVPLCISGDGDLVLVSAVVC